MRSLIEEFKRQEAAAQVEADRLRDHMEELSQVLAAAGDRPGGGRAGAGGTCRAGRSASWTWRPVGFQNGV